MMTPGLCSPTTQGSVRVIEGSIRWPLNCCWPRFYWRGAPRRRSPSRQTYSKYLLAFATPQHMTSIGRRRYRVWRRRRPRTCWSARAATTAITTTCLPWRNPRQGGRNLVARSRPSWSQTLCSEAGISCRSDIAALATVATRVTTRMPAWQAAAFKGSIAWLMQAAGSRL